MTSRLYLPKIEPQPATILDHLIAHFPQIPADTWRTRVMSGLVSLDDGTILGENSPYRHGVTVLYSRDVLSEPASPDGESIVYRDDEILVVDKPHGMPVTPAGEYMERSLLIRLQRSTGLNTLAPAHRLDRETGGIVLFTIDPASRGRYQNLFSSRNIEREYLAIARVVDAPDRKHWLIENRLEPGTPWYRQQVTDGRPNAITEIELLELRPSLGLFRIKPRTGRTHQIRVHMASIGFPIVGDPVYPEVNERLPNDLPLQLLAHRLSFTDPRSGEPRSFESERKLSWG